MNERSARLGDARILLPFLLITLIWGSTWIVIKGQLGAVPSSWSVSYRFLIAGGAMLAMLRLSRLRVGLDSTGHGIALLLGALQFVANYNLVYAAEQHITSGLAAVVFALLVVPNALFARLLFRVAVHARFVAGSIVALAGVGLLFLQEVRSAGTTPDAIALGLGLTLLAVLAASCANVMQLMPALAARSTAAMLGWAMLYGGLGDAALAFVETGPPRLDARLEYWLGLVYLSIVASALAFWLYYRIIRAVGPGRAAYSSILIPIVAMAISTMAEDYRWTPLAAAGGLLAIAGLVIALGARPIAPGPHAD